MTSVSVGKKIFNRLFSVIWILSACAIFIPLLFPDVQYRLAEISQAGSFGKTLQTSVLLKIFEGVSIGSTLPSLVNIFLDKIYSMLVLKKYQHQFLKRNRNLIKFQLEECIRNI